MGCPVCFAIMMVTCVDPTFPISISAWVWLSALTYAFTTMPKFSCGCSIQILNLKKRIFWRNKNTDSPGQLCKIDLNFTPIWHVYVQPDLLHFKGWQESMTHLVFGHIKHMDDCICFGWCWGGRKINIQQWLQILNIESFQVVKAIYQYKFIYLTLEKRRMSPFINNI